MCGRFVSSTPPDELARYFQVAEVAEAVLDPSYNVAPTNDIYVVLESGGLRRLDVVHWGLVPFWAKDINVGNRMINARAESLPEKNAFKHAFKKRRCIIPVDGFYEWKKVPGQKQKQPMYIERRDGEPIALAGLWEVWRPKDADPDDDSQLVRSCTIITGDPNEKIAEIHDRMPVILPPGAWDAWLDRDNDDIEALGKLLVPAPSELLVVRPVSTAVNNVRQNTPELIAPLDDQ
jgi:putative SOS response-associated peptidase YedK